MKEYKSYILLNADAEEKDIEVAKRMLRDALTLAEAEGKARLTVRRERNGIRVGITVK